MKKKFSRQDAVYSIALAGIAAGLALLFVWLGVVTKFTTIACFVAASLCVMIPMNKKYYLSSVIAFAVSAGLSFVITGDIVSVIGYILYFGPIGLLTAFFYNIKLKWWIQLIIKVVFINGVLAILYYVFGTIIISLDALDVKYWMVAVLGTIILVAIDYAVQYIYKSMLPIINKALRKTGTKNEVVEENDNHDDSDDDHNDPLDGTFEV